MTGRRIAAAVLTVAVSLGIASTTAGAAQAMDTSWPTLTAHSVKLSK